MDSFVIFVTLLQIAKIFVEGDDNGVAYQSTTYNTSYGPFNAIDGNITTASITKNKTNQFWQYKLPNSVKNMGYHLKSISVQLRGEGRYLIQLDNNSRFDICANNTHFQGKQHTWVVNCSTKVNTVRITKMKPGQLIIYEVKLNLCINDTFEGQCITCQKSCVNNSNFSVQSLSDTTCPLLKDDAHGFHCKEKHSYCLNCTCLQENDKCTECVKGKHGNYCNKNCSRNCLDNECDSASGKCISCLPGYYGDTCDKQCNTSICFLYLCDSDKSPIILSCQESCDALEKKNISLLQETQLNTTLTDCLISCSQMHCKTGNKTLTTENYKCSDCIVGSRNISCMINEDGQCDASCRSCRRCLDLEDFGKIKSCADWLGNGSVNKDYQDRSGKGIWITLALITLILLLGITLIGLIKSGFLRHGMTRVLQPDEPIQVFSSLMKTKNPNDNVINQTTEESTSNAETASADNTLAKSANLTESNMYINYSSLYNKISVGQFLELIKKMKESGKIRQEYKTLPDGLLEEHSDALKPLNRRLNRYKNIYPYNINRVVLDVDKCSSESDFINASYVHGYNCRNRYVAAQGPFTDQTVSDFWRMIWQLNSNTIVMLTNVIENGVTKCLRYWPEQEAKQHGKIQVKMVETQELQDFTKRIIEMSVGDEKKRVTQFHFTAWPDKGIPKSKSSLLQFRKAVILHPINEMPIVVHCSAGIGRSGTFISLDYLLNEADDEGSIDVIKCISTMRRQRTNVIQSWEQYEFLYETLAESLQDTQHKKTCYTDAV